MEKFSEIKKQKMGEMEQINPNTGISMDYFNQYSFLIQIYKEGGIDNLKREIKNLKKEGINTRILNYSDVYHKYDFIVNEKSKENISEIDNLATHLDKIIMDVDNLDEKDFIDTCNRLNILIYGEESSERDLELVALKEAA